jgi:RimJ/RimL family protein N-acetyltransferase
MVDCSKYDIRYSQEADLPYLTRWVDNPSILKWFPMSTAKEVEDALRCWIGFSRFKSSLTATSEDRPVGIVTLFLMPYKKVAHHCLLKIAVDPDMHRKGIGSDLVKNAKHLAKSYFRLESIHAEVFEGNPLIPILQAQGFYQVIRQERYVKTDKGYLARILLECNLA